MPVKILDIVWYKFLPARFGGQKGIDGFLTALSESYEVVVLCSRDNKSEGSNCYKLLPLLPTGKWQFFNNSYRQLIKKICKEERVTHICIEHPYYARAALKVGHSLGLPVIIHNHNIESERFKSLGKWWWKIMWYYEGWACRKAGLNLFKTNTDKLYAIKHYKLPATKCMVLPYCLPQDHQALDKGAAAAATRKRFQIPATNKLLLFNGTLDYGPNAKAVERIYKNIVPLLQALSPWPFTILICGRNELPAFNYLEQLHHPMVQQTGVVENIETLVAAADLFINPVLEGGGIKTKIIDALGQHTTVVSFASGAFGIDTDCTGGKLQLCTDGDYVQFVQFIVSALQKEIVLTPQAFFDSFKWQRYIDALGSRYFDR
ncbi:MAG: glycosyltransferase [Bacteroidota bacterium]